MKIKQFSIFSFLILFASQLLFAQTGGNMVSQSAGQAQNTFSHYNYNSGVSTPVEVDPDDYMIGSGDKFLIQINHLTTTTFSVDVSPIGEMMIPGIGQVHISELKYSEAVKLIKDKCKQRYSTADVDVNLYDVRNVHIPVFGAVQNHEMITLFTESDVNNVTEPSVKTPQTAGTIQKRDMTGVTVDNKYALPASLRLSDLMSMLSLHYLAKDFEIEVRGYDDTTVVNIYNYYLKGDLDENPFLYKIRSIYIPYADVAKECIHVYGPINTKTIVPIIPGEKVYEFIQRKIQLTDITNYDAITLKRDGKIILDQSNSREDQNIELLAGDILEVSGTKRIMVNGFVREPGIYNYIQGHTVADYIAMAGGVDVKGSNKSVMIIRNENKIRNAENKLVERGDIIIVNRSMNNIFLGEISVLGFLSMIASIFLSFIVAYNTTPA
ncbi:MAG: polysaccharide biosynthesis/export family protein [Candidatus Marinimicrobia bacterium]|nr:polysaccharide biosynthesis/export family protein [Candidatus Neomarinimicrobiota bacterium]